jgi:hypothetical protein
MHLSFSVIGKSHLRGDQLSLWQFKEVFRDMRECTVMIYRVLRSYVIGGDPTVSNKVLKEGRKRGNVKKSEAKSKTFKALQKVIDDHKNGAPTGVEPDYYYLNRSPMFQNVLSEAKPRYKQPRSQQEFDFRERYCEYDAVPANHEGNDITSKWRELYGNAGDSNPGAAPSGPKIKIAPELRRITPGYGPGCDFEVAYKSGQDEEKLEE